MPRDTCSRHRATARYGRRHGRGRVRRRLARRPALATSRIQSVGASGVTTILHVGDFGLWPGNSGKRYLQVIETTCARVGVELLVTPGNHEDWARLTARWADPKRRDPESGARLPLQLADHIQILPRGHRFTIGRTTSCPSVAATPSTAICASRGWIGGPRRCLRGPGASGHPVRGRFVVAFSPRLRVPRNDPCPPSGKTLDEGARPFTAHRRGQDIRTCRTLPGSRAAPSHPARWARLDIQGRVNTCLERSISDLEKLSQLRHALVHFQGC
jgi:hypothetical protein